MNGVGVCTGDSKLELSALQVVNKEALLEHRLELIDAQSYEL